ncbi:MAG: hypothetical protein KTR31_17055 [Myxococcales bacterium]|nr:hypothetical protein [Myxococcales bacterium]
MITVMVAGLLACTSGRGTAQVTAPLGDLECGKATLQTSAEGQASPAPRWAEGTAVQFCTQEDGTLHGPQLERYADGSVAVQGEWRKGERAGDWTRWTSQGAFSASVTYVDGRAEGVRREVSDDGLVVELVMAKGVAVDLRTLPADTPMPEWREGVLTEGLAHAAAAPPP